MLLNGLAVYFTCSIHRGDLSLDMMQQLSLGTDWPPITKPAKWTASRRPVVVFGALIGSSLTSKADTEEIDLLVKDEVFKTGGYGDPPKGLPSELSESEPTSEEFLAYVNSAYERELDVLDRMIADASQKKDELAKMREETKKWTAQRTRMLNQYAKTRVQINFEQLWNEGQDIFEAAYKAQRSSTLMETPLKLPPGVPTIQTAIRSMAAMVWFFEKFDSLEAESNHTLEAESKTDNLKD
jgi:hypothetical protein